MADNEFEKPGFKLSEKGSGSGFADKVKNAYYKIEDKWYGFLDKVDKKVPVYKIVDPIDRVIPSLILFIAVIIVIVIGIAFIFSGFSVAAESIVQVVDDQGTALSSVDVEYVFEGERGFAVADSLGQVKILGEGSITIEIYEEGYQDYSETLSISSSQITTITLQQEVEETEMRTVVVQTPSNDPLNGRQITVTFSCSSTSSSPRNVYTSNPTIYVEEPSDCGTLDATVTVSGFQPLTKSLLADRTIFSLQSSSQPQVQQTAKIRVSVTDTSSNPLSGIRVNLYEVISGREDLVQERYTQSSGTYVFDVPFGTYKVVAVDDSGQYETETSDERTVSQPNEEANIFLELDEIPTADRKKIYIKAVDSLSDPVADCSLIIFADNVKVADISTGSTGTLEWNGADTTKEYDLVIMHSDFVTKIVEDVALLDPLETNPVVITLEEAEEDSSGDPENYGIIEVTVEDDSGNAVRGAEISVFAADYGDLIVNTAVTTDSSGEAEISNMPAGNYFVRAIKNQVSEESSTEELDLGNTLEFSLTLSGGQGILSVLVNDKGSGNPVEQALVRLNNYVTGYEIERGRADSQGYFESSDLTTDVIPIAIVQHDTYLDYYSNGQVLQNNEQRDLTIPLYPENDYTNLDLELLGVYDDSGQLANSLSAGETYTFKFNLVNPEHADSVIASFRVGEDSESLQDMNYAIGSMGYNHASHGHPTAEKSTTVDPNDYFATGTSTNGNAKQVNLHYNDLDGAAVYEITFNLIVENDLTANAPIKIYYLAKAAENGTEILSTEHSQSYNSNQPVACDPSTQNCPDFSFAFTLKHTGDQGNQLEEQLQAGNTYDLNMNEQYDLDYIIENTGSNNFSNIDLYITSDPSDVFTFSGSQTSPIVEQLSSLDSGTSTSDTLTFTPANTYSNASLKFELNTESDSNTAIIYFNVKNPSTANQLQLDFEPSEVLYPGRYYRIYVRDPSGNLVSNANIIITDLDTGITSSGINQEGYAGLGPLPSDFEGRVISFEADAPGFDSVTVEKTVQSSGVQLLQDTRFDCIDFGSPALAFTQGVGGSFQIINNCSEQVEFNLFQANNNELTVNPETFSLASNGSETINVSGADYPGRYGILIQGKFQNDFEFTTFKDYNVNVRTPAGYYFSINKTEFDILNNVDSGQVSTLPAYYQFVASHNYPDVSLQTTEARAYYNDPQNIQNIAETYYLDVDSQGNITWHPYSDSIAENDTTFIELNDTDPEFEFNVIESGDEVHVNYADFLMTDEQFRGEWSYYRGEAFAQDPDFQLIETINDPEIKSNSSLLLSPGLLDNMFYQRQDFEAGESWTYLAHVYNSNPRRINMELGCINQGYFYSAAESENVNLLEFPIGDPSGDAADYFESSLRASPPTSFFLDLAEGWTVIRADCLTTDPGAVPGGGLASLEKISRQVDLMVPSRDDQDIGIGALHKINYISGVTSKDLNADFIIPLTQDNYLDTKCNPVETEFDYLGGSSINTPTAELSCDSKPVWQGIYNVCDGKASCNTNVQTARNYDEYIANSEEGVPYYINDSAEKLKISTASGDGTTTKLYGVKVNVVTQDEDHSGNIPFNVYNVSITGNQYSLLDVKDTISSSNAQGYEVAEGSFHVRLNAGSEGICYGRNGKLGFTGEAASPRIFLDWRWNNPRFALDSTSGLGICDNGRDNFIYCDATQFSIELNNKLIAIQDLMESGNYNQRQKYVDFYAYLMEDGYTAGTSGTFQEQFANYYSSIAFAETPAAFHNTTDGLYKLFENKDRFIFTDPIGALVGTRLQDPIEAGLYHVQIDIEFDDPNNTVFFDSGNQPNAVVQVIMEKVEDPSNDNPLLHMPFDGLVGYDPTSDLWVREGFGKVFLGNPFKVADFPETGEIPVMDSGQGITSAGQFTNNHAGSSDEFSKMNNEYRGSLAWLDNELNLLFSNASPVLMKVEAKENNTSSLYYLEGDSGIYSQPSNITKWDGIGSTIGNSVCTDFAGNLLFYDELDNKASSLTNTCSLISGVSSDQAYGFSWSPSAYSSPGDQVFLQTIFYTPVNSNYALRSACRDLGNDPVPNFLDAHGNVIGNDPVTHSLPLNYTKNKPEYGEVNTLKDAFDLIENGKACIALDDTSFDIWWNEQALLSDLAFQYDPATNPSYTDVDFTCPVSR